MNVLVVGDVMIDTNHYCKSFRTAPEADIPVYNVVKTTHILGGAANVAINLKNLGCNVFIVSVNGADKMHFKMQKLFREQKIYPTIFVDEDRKTTNKIRIFNDETLVNRHDIETVSDIDEWKEQSIIEFICQTKNLDAIIISDYAKGVITTKLCETIIDFANKHGIRTFVDPKTNNHLKYRNCFLFKPNWVEATAIVSKKNMNFDDDIVKIIKEEISCQHAIVTCGKNGIYYDKKQNHVCIPSEKPVIDVTGSGDVVLSILVYSILKLNNLHMSCYIANIIATKGTQTVGNYNITLRDYTDAVNRYKTIYLLIDVMPFQNKIIKDSEKLKIIKISELPDIVFTNGCFDIIHSAHIKLLRYAKSLGKTLIVGLNSDSSIRRLKGQKRPINNETERCELLKSLGFIDYIILFQDDTPRMILSHLKPNFIVKGGD